MKNIRKISIVGLGYVGLPLAIEFGRLFHTMGYDVNKKRVDELLSGNDKTREIEKTAFLESIKLKFTSSELDIKDSDIFIVTVPTPINKVNQPDLTPLINATHAIGRVMNKGSIIIFESTVFPGCTEEVCVPILERVSGLKFNHDFFCGYSPERINPGDKVNTLRKIKKITSGSTPDVAVIVDNLYKKIIDAGTHMVSSIKVAEAAKVIENSQRDLNIAFVNELSVIFDRMNLDTLEVLEAAGSKWNFLPFRPGMVGGHCIGVDPYYLTYKAEELGYHPQVILAGRRINDNMARYAARGVIRRMLRSGVDITRARIGVLGVTFKENCPDIRNSKIFGLIDELKLWGAQVVVNDPWADGDEVLLRHELKLESLDSMGLVDAIIVAVGHYQYRNMGPEEIGGLCNMNINPILADLKSIYDKSKMVSKGFEVFRL